jgi:membrane-associated phospholipid phosphatase
MLSWYWRGLSVLSSQDRALTRTLRKSNTGDFKDVLKVFNEFGNVGYASKFSYGVLGLSLLTDNEKFQDAAFTSLESQFISRGIVNLLKMVVGRARPTNYEAAHSFHPFSGRDSFPSGHTVTAFALIAPWIFYYPHTYTYALFLLPTGTAFSRIALDAHWTTDVMAGAAIGIVVSYYLTKWHKKESPQTRFSFSVDDTSLRLVFYPSWLQ